MDRHLWKKASEILNIRESQMNAKMLKLGHLGILPFMSYKIVEKK